MGYLDRLVRDMEWTKAQVKALSGAPQLALSSLENGTIESKDADGRVRMSIGVQDDGAQTVTVINGPIPPVPTPPQVTTDFGSITARWDGGFVDELVAPSDWSRTEIHATPGDQLFLPTRATARGSIVAASGGEVTIGVERGQWTVCLVAWSQAGKLSQASQFVTVDVPGYGDLVQAAIDEAQALIDQAKQALETAQQELDGRLGAVEDGLESIPQDIATARQEAIDAALAEIDAVEGNLTTALGLKNKTTWSTSNPPTTYTGVVEDTWIKLTSLGSGGREIGRWRWNGNVWVTNVIDGAVLSNIDASTITTGFLDVLNRIQTNAILAEKIAIGDFTNLHTDPLFLNPAAAPGSGTGAWTVVNGGLEKNGSGTQSGGYAASTEFPVTPGEKFYAEMTRTTLAGTVPGVVTLYAQEYNSTTGVWGEPIQAVNMPTDGRNTGSFTAGSTTTKIRFGYYTQSSMPAGTRVRLTNPIVRRQVNSTLIEPGGIKTPNLAADVLEVGNLKAGSAALAEAVIQKLWAEVVVARMVTAQEFIGENAILTGAVTASKITASEELWAKIGEFVKIRTGMLEADAVDGMVITGATIQTARTGARVTQDASGLSVYDDADDWRVRLTPYGSTFKGDLEAESLVSTGPAEFRHTENRIAQGARLVLEAGVTDPTAPPVAQPYWASRSFTPPAGGVLYGLAYADSKYWTFVDIPSAADVARVISINPTTGAVGDDIPMTDSFWAAGGVTAIGSELFLLGQKSDTPYKYFVRVYSTAGVFLREWEYTEVGWSKTNPLGYKPGIGTDGTNVVIAHCNDNGSLLWRTYNPSTGALLATVDCKDQTKSDIGGIDIGPADWGGGTWVTVRKTSGEIGAAIVVFSTAGVWDPAKSWTTAENGRDTGLVFADGKFRTLNGGGGRVNEYATPSTGDGESDWWAAYRWEAVENGALVARSRISPPVRFTWPRRARLKVIGSTLPVGVSGIGGAVAKKTSTPVRTDFRQTNTHYRPGEPVALWAYLNADWKTAGIPGDSNTFPTATPSSIVSASSTFEVRGDGTGRWGPLTINPNGTVTNSSDVGWTDLPNPQSPFTERSNGQYMIRAGVVFMRGQYSFTGSGMQTVMTLPPAIRPGYLYQTGAISNTTVNLYWEIAVDGTLKLWSSAATGAWANLTSVSYPIG